MFRITNYLVLWSLIYHIDKNCFKFSPWKVNVITDILLDIFLKFTLTSYMRQINSGGQFWLVANSVHTADADPTKLKISNMLSFEIFSRESFE